MSRAVLILANDAIRARAVSWIAKAPLGTRVEFKEAKRTNDQNALLWPILTEVATQRDWHGVKLSADDWKILFLAALNQEMRLVPNLNGNGFVALGRSSSKLSKDEFSQLIELIYSWGAEHGVQFAERIAA